MAECCSKPNNFGARGICLGILIGGALTCLVAWGLFENTPAIEKASYLPPDEVGQHFQLNPPVIEITSDWNKQAGIFIRRIKVEGVSAIQVWGDHGEKSIIFLSPLITEKQKL